MVGSNPLANSRAPLLDNGRGSPWRIVGRIMTAAGVGFILLLVPLPFYRQMVVFTWGFARSYCMVCWVPYRDFLLNPMGPIVSLGAEEVEAEAGRTSASFNG